MNPKTDYSLSKYWDLCYRAHANTSFSPEKRADEGLIELTRFTRITEVVEETNINEL